MVKIKVLLQTVNEIREFGLLCSEFDCEMTLSDARMDVDPRAIMQVLSLNYRLPLELAAETDDERAIKEAFAVYTVKY